MIKLERNSTKSFINIELRFSRSIIFIRERDFNFKIFNNNKYYKISIVLKKNILQTDFENTRSPK